jgi:hypothetical protein
MILASLTLAQLKMAHRFAAAASALNAVNVFLLKKLLS